MKARMRSIMGVLFTLAAGAISCDVPSEAPRVELAVAVDATASAPVTNDLGYEVVLSEARVALRNVVFTVAGEASASLWDVASEALVGTAYAHPGHLQGGEVTGELLGEYVLDWVAEDQRVLGDATLIATTYQAANFTFARGSEMNLDATDPLIGHTAILSGSATRGTDVVMFTIVVDSPEDRELIGAPFDTTLTELSAGRLGVRLDVLDPIEGDTLFDELDFTALDADGDGVLRIDPDAADGLGDAYNLFRRRFQTHDHYSVHYEE